MEFDLYIVSIATPHANILPHQATPLKDISRQLHFHPMYLVDERVPHRRVSPSAREKTP